MIKNTRTLGIVICVLSLSACTSYSPGEYSDNQNYAPQGTLLYPEGYDSRVYSETYQEKKSVVVPETYHVGAYHSPTPHTDRDREWVNGQNSQGYTIELADGDKASQVANTLLNAPKSERMAEVKYQRDGKTYYKGLYGTYPTYEAAAQALSTLPTEVKQKASVKTWGSVQSGVTQ